MENTLGSSDDSDSGSGSGLTSKSTVTAISYNGYLQISKEFTDITADEVDETFYFEIEVTGTFEYDETSYDEDDSLVISTAYTSSDNDWTWLSEEFTWVNDNEAPTYTITEVDADGWELDSSSGSSGKIIDMSSHSGDDDYYTKAVFTNKPLITHSYINIVKKINNYEDGSTTPTSGEFTVEVTIEGITEYNGTECTSYSETVVLDSSNDYTWDSKEIIWRSDGESPTYTVTEVLDSLPSGYSYVSTSDEITSTTNNDFSSTLIDGTSYVVLQNSYNTVSGNLRVIKLAESDDIVGEEFSYTIVVTGNFTYNGTAYTTYTITDTIKAIDASTDSYDTTDSETVKTYSFEWLEENGAPEYTITENLTETQENDGIELVSIANSQGTTVTNSTSLTDNLIANDTDIVKIRNKGGDPNTKIQIVKQVTGDDEALELFESLDWEFTFEVTIKGDAFTYDGNAYEDECTITVTLTGKGSSEGTDDSTAENVWESALIEWDATVTAPTYEITEITDDLPSYISFSNWSSHSEVVYTSTVQGNIEQGSINTFVAENKITSSSGYISITKELVSDLISSSESFSISLTINGDFISSDYTSGTAIDIDLTGGETGTSSKTWTSSKITWLEEAPTYTVSENLTSAQSANLISCYSIVDNNSGTLVDGVVSIITIYNDKDPIVYYGNFQITKTYTDAAGNYVEGTFIFLVTEELPSGNTITYPVEITTESGKAITWRSASRKWYSTSENPNPSATVVEDEDSLPEGVTLTDSENLDVEFDLQDKETVKVTAINTTSTSNSGYLTIVKELNEIDKAYTQDVSFKFQVVISSDYIFTYTDEQGVVTTYGPGTENGNTLSIVVYADPSTSWTSGEISWNTNAPEYCVSEIGVPSGWYLEKIENTYGTLTTGTTTVTAYNSYSWDWDLTMSIGGTVWNDTVTTDAKESESYANGIMEDGEAGIGGVTVTLYRVMVDKEGNYVAKLGDALVYEDDLQTLTSNVTTTDGNGYWSFAHVAVPAFTEEEYALYGDDYVCVYNVEFGYDGQTYEPTEFLATAEACDGISGTTDVEEKASAYIEDSTTERTNHTYDSVAIDYTEEADYGDITRDEFNNYFAEIIGDEPMDINGDTVGTTNEGVTLNYSSRDSLGGDSTKKISTLDSYSYNGEDLLMQASTAAAGLTYPFLNEDGNVTIHVAGWEYSQTDLYLFDTAPYTYEEKLYHFTATYSYMLNINFGLVEREYTDVSIEKDLTEAIVVVGGKAIKYKFGTATDLSTSNEDLADILYRQIVVADANIEYSLGLYASDYYYRAEIYKTDTTLWNKLVSAYGSESKIYSTELEIYLTYTITVYNESETYDVTINSIADYYEETLTPVSSARAYLTTVNGEEVNSTVNLVSPTLYETGSLYETDNNGVTYYKSEYDIDESLEAGEEASYTVSYKVNKGTYNNIEDCIKLGEKSNIVEITSFSSYYSSTSRSIWAEEGDITGRVDKDSAPDNINIELLNETAYYEDDTDAAPILDIELYDVDREVTGLVWEDAQTDEIEYSQSVGNGYYNADEGDTTIAGLTTELVEIISIPTGETTSSGDIIYEDYEFIWPTDTSLSVLNGQPYSTLTGFNSSIVTDADGNYSFTAIPSGIYKVRFVYGDTPVATGNTEDEVIYNGQDYKSTTYQAGFDNDSDSDGYTDDDWYDLENDDLESTRVSDARDNEARRLIVAAQSEILTYSNTSVLELADELIYDADGNLDASAYLELTGEYDNYYPLDGDGYYMYAETAKLDLEIEFIYDLDRDSTALASSGISVVTVDGDISEFSADVGNEFVYLVKNIDFGLEERSQTELTLDKQIKEITLTTSDGEVVLDAVYDIIYDIGDDDTINCSVTLDKWSSTGSDQIASLNRSKSTQGYRYIMAEGTVLQGATISVLYQLTVFNVGEADTCNQILKDIWEEVNLNNGNLSSSTLYQEALSALTTNYHTKDNRLTQSKDLYNYGLYFGSIYYLGTNGTYLTAVWDEDTNEVDVEDLTNSKSYTFTYTTDSSGNKTINKLKTVDSSGNVTYTNLSRTDSNTQRCAEYVENGYYNILVESTIHEIIDYVDPDVEFIDTDNISENQAWSTTTVEYLINNGLIDPEAVIVIDDEGDPILMTTSTGETKIRTYADGLGSDGVGYTFISDEVQQYITDTKTNVILNIDDSDYNYSLVKPTVPYTAVDDLSIDSIYGGIYYDNYATMYDELISLGSSEKEATKAIVDEITSATILLQVSRYYSSEEDTSEIDNVAEIIKVENTVGRRDIRTVAGNMITYQIDWDSVSSKGYTSEEDIITETVSIYDIAGKEPDSSATEIITLTPPTGSTLDTVMQILAISGFAGVIIAIVIVAIKKKLLQRR